MASEPRFEEIRPRTRRLGHRLVHLGSVGSTMDAARAEAEAGAAEGLVVVADEQTRGMGRLGRSWHSPRGSLLATLVLRPAAPADRLGPLPLAAGVALVEAVRKLARVSPRLKWPNDVLLGGKKVGGILVTSRLAGERAEFVLLGLGVNGDARAEDFPADLRGQATSLSMAAGRHVCLPALLKLFLDAFEPLYDDVVAGRPEAALARAAELTDTLGRRVRVEARGGPVVGLARGLGPRGELVVDASGGEVVVAAGECEELRDA